MAKSLSERIAAMTMKKMPPRTAQNRATFLALRMDVKNALDDGWPVKSIWETLFEERKIDFSYQAFRGYVNRLILTPPALMPITQELENPHGQRDKIDQVTTNATEVKPKESVATGFKFNNTPKKEDLL